mmetsp:Transcript_34061/g.33255  ORF Transcript_34061/g.33255 Transcript_34061/m.33255 type:complete len:94 (+) Transcript_34061:798-1079(+)
MFIIYEGEVGIYVDDQSENCVATLTENKVFGETALEKGGVRSATVIAHSYFVKVLVLRKNDYKNIVLHVKQMEKFNNMEILQKAVFFKEWNLI